MGTAVRSSPVNQDGQGSPGWPGRRDRITRPLLGLGPVSGGQLLLSSLLMVLDTLHSQSVCGKGE